MIIGGAMALVMVGWVSALTSTPIYPEERKTVEQKRKEATSTEEVKRAAIKKEIIPQGKVQVQPAIISTGDPSIDLKVQALQKEMESKIKAIREEYHAKIKAAIGDKKSHPYSLQSSTTLPKLNKEDKSHEDSRPRKGVVQGTSTSSSQEEITEERIDFPKDEEGLPSSSQEVQKRPFSEAKGQESKDLTQGVRGFLSKFFGR